MELKQFFLNKQCIWPYSVHDRVISFTVASEEKDCVQHYLKPCSLLLFLLDTEKQATSFIISLLQCKPNPAYPESNFGSLLKTGPLAAEGLKPSVYLSEPL